MPGRPVLPTKLRSRLTLAFVLVAGVASGALAAASFLWVREARLSDFLERAEREARINLLFSVDLRATTPEEFVRGYASRRVDAVLLAGGRRFESNPTLKVPVPPELRAVAGSGELGYARVTRGGIPYLIVGSRAPGSRAELYFVFSEERVRSELAQLRNVLLLGWGAVLLLSGLVGRALARTTLEPVARASRAARSMAEGLLATRLPMEAGDEFGAWAASFNEMAEALEARVRDLSEAQARERRFTADVAHELRTPLTALVAEASLLQEHLEQLPGEARRPAELLIADVDRLRRLVEELMEISRLDARREPVRVEQVDLSAAAAAVLRSRGWAGEVVLLGGDGVRVNTDRRRLERVLANLIGNAVEHGGRDVRVVVSSDGGGARVEVSDRGRGIEPEHLPHLFDRFYKADPSRSRGGSGLGLAIALENARLLGGDIEVWSEPGVGSRFTLRLPVSQPLHARESAVTSGRDDGAHSRPEGGSG